MNEVILFLLESSVILSVLYMVYYLVLRREASFNFNRFYLLGSLAISFALPLVSFNMDQQSDGLVDLSVNRLADVRSEYQQAVKEWSSGIYDQDVRVMAASDDDSFSWKSSMLNGLIGIYIIGVIVFVFRLIWMFSWILKLKARYPNEIAEGIRIVKLPYQLAPFSFLNSVFVSEEMRDSEEFTQILAHEMAHIRQKHSLDLLIVQLLAAMLWINPVVWWLNKSLKTTHEYIADRKMIKQGYSLVEYQTLLLRQLISNNSFGLVHNFNLSFIKKRITMMKIERLGNLGKFKVAFVIMLTVLFSLIIVQCNSKLDDQVNKIKVPNTSVHADIDLPVVVSTGYTFDSKQSNAVYISLKDDQMAVNGKEAKLEDLASIVSTTSVKTPVYLRIASDQTMKMVYDLQEELRQLDLRLMIYLAKTSSGSFEQIPFQLPPIPGHKSGIQVPELTDEFVRENNIDLLKVDMGSGDVGISGRVASLVRKNMSEGRSDYVIVGQYSDSDTYGHYLTNLQTIKKVFYDIYEQRAQQMFGKSFMKINREQKTSEEAKQQYREVRQGIPMAITTDKI